MIAHNLPTFLSFLYVLLIYTETHTFERFSLELKFHTTGVPEHVRDNREFLHKHVSQGFSSSWSLYFPKSCTVYMLAHTSTCQTSKGRQKSM